MKLFKLFLIVSVLIFSSSFNYRSKRTKHPIKLTSSLIQYDAKTNSIKMACRVFIDDFENSINTTLPKKINVSKLTKADKTRIEAYFNKFYHITFNDKKLSYTYKSSQIHEAYNVFDVEFSKTNLTIKKGDQLLIENSLFFEEFGHYQTNRICIRIPPFFDEQNCVNTLRKNIYSHTF